MDKFITNTSVEETDEYKTGELKRAIKIMDEVEYLGMLFNLSPQAKAEWMRGEMIIENGEPTYELCYFNDDEK